VGQPELARLAGSVLGVGLRAATLSPDERAELVQLSPGALVLFARNVSSLAETRTLLVDAREAIGGEAPALGCVDQEGGRVVRLRFAVEAMPSMLALGATGDEQLAERSGRRLAEELRAIGANVDFAPVLDLALEPRNSVVGTRALGGDPRAVARLGAALVRGVQSRGVAATAKHFPGHGATVLDSHVALPVVEADAATLRARELVPFEAAFAAGVRAVMSAHVLVPALDTRQPATLSRRILTGLLREELGFEGVCFTDCLQMGAIADGAGTAEGAVAALIAGADLALVSHDLELARAARDAIVAAVTDGSLAIARLEEAAARVARLRTWAAAAATPAEFEDDGIASEVARGAITVVRGRARLEPGRPVTIVSFEGDASDGIAASDARRPSLSLALRRRRVRSELLRVPLAPDDAMIEMLAEVARAQGERQFVLIARRARSHAAQRRALDMLFAVAPHAIAVAGLEPFDVAALEHAENVVCSYGDEPANIEALADLLAGVREGTSE
jgi:beta-N-acetylhexosaminidase